MGGLFILALAVGYLWLVYQIARRVPRWAKPLVVIAAVLVVSADGYLGRKKLEQLCEEQGGLHIYETAEGVEGFELYNSSPNRYWIERYGYAYVEGWPSSVGSQKVNRLIINSNSDISLEENVQSISIYMLKFFPDNNSKFNYYYDKYRIINKTKNSIMAEFISIGYYGGWAERFIGSIFASNGAVAYCFSNSSKFENLDNMTVITLKPKTGEVI